MIKLKQVRLINWYAFGEITIPIGLFHSGLPENGNGKSVFLDAVEVCAVWRYSV